MFKRKKKKARVEGGVETVGGALGICGEREKVWNKDETGRGRDRGEQGSQMGKGCTGLGDKYFKRSFCVKTHT